MSYNYMRLFLDFGFLISELRSKKSNHLSRYFIQLRNPKFKFRNQ